MKLAAPRWLVNQRLTPEARAEIAAAEPAYLRVAFVLGKFGAPDMYQCSLWDPEAECVARGTDRTGIEAFRAACERIEPLTGHVETATWRGVEVPVVDPEEAA